jgi:hypothetical protein
MYVLVYRKQAISVMQSEEFTVMNVFLFPVSCVEGAES